MKYKALLFYSHGQVRIGKIRRYQQGCYDSEEHFFVFGDLAKSLEATNWDHAQNDKIISTAIKARTLYRDGLNIVQVGYKSELGDT